MVEATAKIYGFLILSLAIIGVLAGEKQFLGFLNVDVALDITRLALAAILFNILYGQRGSIREVRFVLGAVGIIYIGLGILGLFDSSLWGMLPSKLSVFDEVFHLVAGVGALGVAVMGTDTSQIRR